LGETFYRKFPPERIKMEKGKKIWMDGELVDWDDATVHVLTHTLHYGFGVFEGIRCYRCTDGQSAVFRLSEHTDRLFASAHIAMLEIPFSAEEINSATVETIKANGLKEAYIRPLVYLGYGSMGLFPRDNPVKVSIAAWSWGAYLGEEGIKKGIRIKVSSFSRQHFNTCMTKAKLVGNYVNSILAKREVVAAGYDEALLLDTDGYVSEGSGENIFIVWKTTLITPPASDNILVGITRESVITLAREELGVETVERSIDRSELYIADECFMTGTAAHVSPVLEVDHRSVGNGKIGPVTAKLQKLYFDLIRGKLAKRREWCTPAYSKLVKA